MVYFFQMMMRKRISKEKGVLGRSGKEMRREDYVDVIYPSKTLSILHHKNICLLKMREFEKERISNIVRGRTIQSIKFLQIQKNCSFEQFMNKYYTFQETASLFTHLVSRNCLHRDITFVDFKLKNYRIMNSYSQQIRNIHSEKDRSTTHLTASCSITRDRHFKELESVVKKITKKNIVSSRPNTSHSYTHLLVENIEKMLSSHKENSIIEQENSQAKSIRREKQHIFTEEMLNNTPEDSHLDCYGLQQFRSKQNSGKMQWASMINPNDSRFETLNKYTQNMRHQTEYDTENIFSGEAHKAKGKSSNKKSVSRSKRVHKFVRERVVLK